MRPILLRSLGGLMLGLLLLMQGCASLPSLAGRPACHAPGAGARQPARSSDPPLDRGPSQSIGRHPSEARARRVRGPRAARRRGRAHARRAVLHLARRPVGHAAVRALWRAADRGVRVRLLLDDNNTGGLDDAARRAGRASEHRGAAVQPVRDARLARARIPHRLRAPEPAHAQQVVHRRQPGDDRRRAQRRRRVLRRGRRRRCSWISTCWRSAPSSATCRRTSTATGPARRPIRPAASCAGRRAASTRSRQQRRSRSASPEAAAYLEAVRDCRSCASCWRGELPFEWATARWSATIPQGLGTAGRRRAA